MTDWPAQLNLPHWQPVINTWTLMLGPEAPGRIGGAPASITWTAANRAIYIPVLVPALMTVAQLYHYNGATASGNIDVGLYDIGYTKLVSAGATAQTGTATFQVFNVTDTQVAPGIYYVGVSLSGTVGTTMASALTASSPGLVGIVMQETAHPLPATMTPISAAGLTGIPFVGLTDRTVF